MIQTTPTNQESNVGPGADRINSAYAEADAAKLLFVEKAVICGQMMVEQRSEMSFCHRDKNLPWQGAPKPESDKFTVWITENCPDIHQRTAYRWMAAAARVVLVLLERHASDPQVWIELDGERHYISTVLTMPESECTEAMRTFRATFSKFLEDKTLTEAAAATLTGADDPSRIARAGFGANDGGTNDDDDRKDWPLFVARKFHDISVHLAHWDAMTETQRTETKSAIRAMVLGDEVKLPGRPGGRNIIRPALNREKTPQMWPQELCVAVGEALRERLKK